MVRAAARSPWSTLVPASLLVVACTRVTGDATEGSGAAGSTGTGDPAGASSTSGASATSSPDDTTHATTAEPSCELPPVDARTVDALRIHADQPAWLYRDVASGRGLGLYLGIFGDTIPETILPVAACVAWSVEPTDGVTVDASGMLRVDAAVPAGTTFTVTADVEDGRHVTTADLTVYAPVSYDLLGPWTEVERLPCDGGAPYEPDPAVAEVVLYDNGELTVSWTAFEGIVDYWATFAYDERTGALVLSVDGPGNDPPADLDGEGTARVVDGRLVVEDMWLGSAPGGMTPVACGHVLERPGP